MSYPTCNIMRFQVLTKALLKIQIFLVSYTMSLGKQFHVSQTHRELPTQWHSVTSRKTYSFNIMMALTCKKCVKALKLAMWETYSGLSLCGISSLRASSVNVMSECNMPNEQNANSPWTEGGCNLTLENQKQFYLVFIWYGNMVAYFDRTSI